MTKFNVGFKCNDVLLEVTLVKEILIAGLPVRKISRTAWSCTGVDDIWLERIQKVADKYWYF